MIDLAQFFLNISNSLIPLGYFGIFLVGFIGSATIFFPVPSYVVIFIAATTLDPFLIGIVAGTGAAIGELIGYAFGWGGRKLAKKKWEKQIKKWEKAFDKYGGFLVIVFFGATPLPDDIVGILAGTLNYNIKKFFVAVLIGKIIFHWILAYAAFYSIDAIINIFGIAL